MRSCRTSVLATGLALATFASAQVASLCPAKNQVCFKLNIPADTASSGKGDIFFQVSAPSSYQWVALGQGRGMVGSNIFVVYTSSGGKNVTLSPRLATSYSMPSYNGDAKVELLAGSGVSNGLMTANVKCSNCNSWNGGSMDFKAGNGNWIYGFQGSGGAKNTDDQNANIDKHSQSAAFSWDFTNAKGGSSINPFVASTTTPNASGASGTQQPSQPTQTNSDGSPSSGTTDSPSGFTELAPSGKDRMLIAHGVLAALVFVIFFPAGAIAVRLARFPGVVMLHSAFQIFTYMVFIAAVGLGIYIAKTRSLLDEHHPIIGLIVFAFISLMPILGILHHSSYKKNQRRGIFSHLHIWIGRIAITLGIINGGLGIDLAGDASKGAIVAYGVIAGLMWLAWMAAAVLGERRKSRSVEVDPVIKESSEVVP